MSVSLFSRTSSSQFQRDMELYASSVGADRLIRKEVSLGAIRSYLLPSTHIGLTLIAPWLEVATDDVIFNYINPDVDGLAPARAEDAEAELAQKDDAFASEGRASVIDWSLKDRYAPSDVNRYREMQRILQAMLGQGGSLPMTVTSALEDWAGRLARDAALRRRKLDNRIELMIMTAIASGVIAYNDGKIKFTVDFGRPASQSAGDAANDLTMFGSAQVTNGVVDWSSNTHDPIGLIDSVKEYMFLTYGIRMDRILTTRQVLRRIVNSTLFAQRSGMGLVTKADGTAGQANLRYLLDGWGPDAAQQVVENATGVSFIEYDSVYRTRPIGSNTITQNRFFPEGRMVFLPSADSVSQFDDTQIGFAKTLTSPHPEGNWQPGFYEWEQSRKDPWGYDVGTGVKAFPVFPHMEYTYALDVTL